MEPCDDVREREGFDGMDELNEPKALSNQDRVE